ncbi:MAG: hormogonium polysaccharide biosynthesis glycosyltransferase HpsE [Cyanobacteria bacterium J06623_4]
MSKSYQTVTSVAMTQREIGTNPATAATPPEAALDITVAIPTYNGASRLPSLLENLRAQIHTDHITWEVVVCDNGSTDDTKDVVLAYQSNWPSHVPLVYRFVPEQGAAFARQYAVEGSQSNLIAFLDDDNLPSSNWVSQAYQFAQSHPKVGAFGSQIHGKFESELPEELTEIRCFLAIIERGEEATLYQPKSKILPPAAGLVVRRQAWLNAVPKRLFLNNKGKSAGLASEDLEAILHIQKSGWEVWYNPNMVVHHDIPDGRLRKDYLVTLFRCVGLSRYHIRLLGLPKWQRSVTVPAYIANDIRRLALHRMRYGKQQELNTVESCNRELLASTLRSPLFLLKKAYRDRVQSYRDRQTGHSKQLPQLAHAFEQDQFVLYRQGIFDIDQLPVAGVALAETAPSEATSQQAAKPVFEEIFVRLLDAQGKDTRPHQFFPAAKRYALMRLLDRHVVRTLFKYLSDHNQQCNSSLANADTSSPVYSVNLSAASVQDSTLLPFIKSKLAQYRLPPQLFCFEIPATDAIAHPASIRQLRQQLRDIGCKIAFDDFLPSADMIALINQLPVNYIKIDASTLQDTALKKLGGKTRYLQLKDLLQNNSIQGIAKGIENQHQLNLAKQQNIRYVQGYQVSHPQPLEL